MGYKASGCAPTAARRSVQEPVRLELGRDLLDGLLAVRGRAGPRPHDLAAAAHQEDDLRLVDAIDEARELLRLVFGRTGPEGDRDRVEVERGAEVRGRDDVLDLDLRVLLNRDAGRLDLLRDEVDRGLDVLEALRAGADDFTAAEQEDRGLRLLDPIDESGELLRLVLGATEGEGDRLEVELAPEGGRRDDVFDPEVGHGEPPRRPVGRRGLTVPDTIGGLYASVRLQPSADRNGTRSAGSSRGGATRTPISRRSWSGSAATRPRSSSS